MYNDVTGSYTFELPTWATGDTGGVSGENATIADGFNFGPWATDYSSPPMNDGLIAPQNRADTEWSWFDQSKLKGTFSDILNAGIGAAKVAVDQEIRGSKNNQNLGFFDVLRNSALDRFSSSKTGKEIRSQVVASQIRTFFQNPLYVMALIVIVIGGIYLVRR